MASSKRARFVSVGTKLTSAMLLVLALVTAFTYLEVNRNEREQLLASKERAATMVTELFAAGVTAPLSFGDEAGTRESVALLMKNANVLCGAVWAMNGAVPGDKLAETTRGGFLPEPAPAPSSTARIERRPEALVVEQPVRSASGEVLGMVRVAFSLQQENAAIVAAQRRTLVTSLALALGLGFVVLVLTRTLIVRRLARLAGAAKRLEEGKAVDIDLDANDEVGRLARAFASMTDAIASREALISARNRDLRRVLDNVTEGLFTVDKDGRMSDERSRILDSWFGVPVDPHGFFHYFESFAPLTARWLRIGFSGLRDDFLPVEVVLDGMPRRFGHHARSFELEYLPIWVGPEEAQVLGEVLVVVRDVTSRVEHERAEVAQRVAMSVFRRVLNDHAGFAEFSREATRLVEAIAERTEIDSVLLRDLHTLKGNAAVYGIETVADVCHRIETRIDAESARTITTEEVRELRAAWSSVRQVHDELARSSKEERIELRRDEYLDCLGELEARLPGDRLTATVRTWADELASTRLERIVEQGQSQALRMGKPGVVVEAHALPPNLRLPAARWTPIWSMFAHVLRNTLDHGIEGATARASAGKTTDGKVTITLAAFRSGVELRVQDDGGGIAWSKIRERAAALGLPHETDADLEEALYADRVTSCASASATSGRGVGMGAVRDAIRACGGVIAIETAAGRGTTLRIRLPLSMLDSPRTSTFPSLAPKVA